MPQIVRWSLLVLSAFVLFGGPLWWAYLVGAEFRQWAALQMRTQKIVEGMSPAEVAQLTDDDLLADGFGMQFDPDRMKRLQTADLLVTCWWLWAVIVCLMCWGIDRLVLAPAKKL